MPNAVRSLTSLTILAAAFAPATAQAASRDTGGIGAPSAPTVRTVQCLTSSDIACISSRAVVRGGTVRISGNALAGASRVIFRGAKTRRDDTSARPKRRKAGIVDAVVPAKARTGPVVVVDKLGRQASTRGIVRVSAAPAIDAAPGTGFFLGGKRKPLLAFNAPAAGPVPVEVLGQDGVPIGQFTHQAIAGANTAAWNGLLNGRSVATGRYRLRAAGVNGEEFTLFDNLFPIRGKHDIAPSQTTGFGGGRGHQGIDTFARCGTKLVAARAGKVQFAGYQSAAGNYLVIDVDGSGQDHTYMHLREAPLVATGQRVFTGQKVGEVGDTGRATGCHLHFELWTAPGWYEGGKAIDAEPLLRRWSDYE